MGEIITIDGRDTDGVTDLSDGTTLRIEAGAVLSASGRTFAADLGGYSALVVNLGTIDGTGLSPQGAALAGTEALFTVRNEGAILAQNSLAVSGGSVASGLDLVNTGTISRSGAGSVVFAQSGRIENAGVIEGAGGAPLIAVDRFALPLDIVNTGRLDAGAGGTVIDASGFFTFVVFGGDDDTLAQPRINVFNDGTIVGDVTLGTGRDRYETTADGVLDGSLDLGGADDSLYVNVGGADLVGIKGTVTGGEGIDTVSYEVRADGAFAPLAFDFERLMVTTATSEADVSLAGEPAGYTGVFVFAGAGSFTLSGDYSHLVADGADDQSETFIQLSRRRFDGDDVGTSPTVTNEGTITIRSLRDFSVFGRDAGVTLDNFTRFFNEGTVTAIGVGAIGVEISSDLRENPGVAVNSGRIELISQSTGVWANGGRFTNEGTITGNGDGVEVRADSAEGPVFVNTASGIVNVTGNAVIGREDVAVVRNEGLLASSGRSAILSDQGRFDAPDRFEVVNQGDGIIRGGAGRAILGADDTEVIVNQDRARIEGDIELGEDGDVVRNLDQAVIAGDVDMGDGGDAVTNESTIQGSVLTGAGGDGVYNSGLIEGAVDTGSGGDVYQVVGGAGRVTGRITLGTGNDRFEIGALREWRPADFAGGVIDAGTNTSDVRRDTVSMTVTEAERLGLFDTPQSFEGLRIDHETSEGTTVIRSQTSAYDSGYVWLTGLGRVTNRLDITRDADASIARNVGLLVDDTVSGTETGFVVINEANILAVGAGRSGEGAARAYAVYQDIDTTRDHVFINEGTIEARNTGAVAALHDGSDSTRLSNTEAIIRNEGTITASGGADGLIVRQFREGSTSDISQQRGFTNADTGTISVSGDAGAVGVDFARVLATNAGVIEASGRAVGVLLRGRAEIHNTGTNGAITAEDGLAVFAVGDDNVVVNDAVISANDTAIASRIDSDGDDGELTVVNRGTITARTAFLGEGGNEVLDNQRGGIVSGDVSLGADGDRVDNAGRIDGDVFMGGGNDALNALGGTTNGNVDLGAGDDSLFLNAGSASAAGITGSVFAGVSASEVDTLQIAVSGRGTADARASSVLSGFEVLRVDGIDGGETLTFGDVGTVTTGLEVVLLAGGGRAPAQAVIETDFSVRNLRAVLAQGGDRLLRDGDVGGVLTNLADIGITFAASGTRASRVTQDTPEAVFVTAGAELRNAGTITANGAVTYLDRFDDQVTRVAAAVRTGDTDTDDGDVVAPYITNLAGAFIVGVGGAEAIDTDGGAIIVNAGTISAGGVAGSDAAAMDLGNDRVVNGGIIEGTGATSAIDASRAVRITNAEGGVIRAQTDAVVLDGTRASVENEGTMSASGGAVIVTDTDEQRIVNEGLMQSGAGGGFAVLEFRGEFDTTNTGDRNRVFNSGTIEKLGSGTAIFGATDSGRTGANTGDGTAELIWNSGQITGEVDLGDGSDVLYARGGRIDGNVFMGREGDVLVLGDGLITGGVLMGGGEDTVLTVAGTDAAAPLGGISAGTGVDAAGVLFFEDGSTSLSAQAGFEMAAIAAIGLETDVTVGRSGEALGVSLRTMGAGRITNRHDIQATFGRAAIEVEDRDVRLVNEGTLRGQVGIDDHDVSLRLENRGTIEVSQFGILARGDGIERESEELGDVGRPIFNAGTIRVQGTAGIGIANLDTRQDTVDSVGLQLGLTNVFDQRGTLEPRDLPDLDRSVLISNTGTIEVAGARSVGVFTDDRQPVVQNAGVITAAGQQARGIVFADEDGSTTFGAARILNVGTVAVSGAGSDAIVSRARESTNDDPNAVVNAGTIRAVGTGFDRSDDYDRGGSIVDVAAAIDINIGIVDNQEGGVIEATDPFGVAIITRTSSARPGQNGDDEGAPVRTGNSVTIVNDGTISGTDGFFAAYRRVVDPDEGSDYFAYDNVRYGAITGGSGTERVVNRGTIEGDVVLGGAGDTLDQRSRIDGDVYMEGGADTVLLGSGAQIDGVLDLGSGRDTVTGLSGHGGGIALEVSGGEGRDVFAVSDRVLTRGARIARVTDFETGEWGDVIDLTDWSRSNFDGLGREGDLFDAGVLRLRARDADGDGTDDLALQVLRGTDDVWTDALILLDTERADIASTQFAFAEPDPLPLIEGSRRADRLEGTNADERLTGLGGDDLLIGSGGADVLEGGAGNDVLYGDGGPA